MKILISGSTGLVGSAAMSVLGDAGHQMVRLTRQSTELGPDAGDVVRWDPAAGSIDVTALEGLDAVVHLAGENIAAGRWTAAMKERIRASRVDGTKLLCESLAKLDAKPKTLVCASAIGYYGNRGDEIMVEDSPPSDDFLGEVCQAWEAAADAARDAGIRVVHLRIGVVLSSRGGALRKMLLPFKMCAGGIVGSGKQWWSWVSIHDLVGAIQHALENEQLAGPVNTVSPNTVTNREFTKTLGKVLHRPTIVPMPAFAVKLAFGEMGEELLLASTRVTPQRLLESGYEFRFPELGAALAHVIETGT
jgi:hypothetical protein